MWINIFYPSTKIKYWLKLRLLLTQIKIYSKLINLLFHTKHKIIMYPKQNLLIYHRPKIKKINPTP